MIGVVVNIILLYALAKLKFNFPRKFKTKRWNKIGLMLDVKYGYFDLGQTFAILRANSSGTNWARPRRLWTVDKNCSKLRAINLKVFFFWSGCLTAHISCIRSSVFCSEDIQNDLLCLSIQIINDFQCFHGCHSMFFFVNGLNSLFNFVFWVFY